LLGELQGLLALTGRAVALEILLEGRVFDAAEAHAKGLLTRVVPAATLDEEIDSAVRRITSGAPAAARVNKAAIARLAPRPPPLTVHELEAHFDYYNGYASDHTEGVSAFLPNRRPKFTGEMAMGPMATAMAYTPVCITDLAYTPVCLTDLALGM